MRRITVGILLLSAASLVWSQQINTSLLDFSSAKASLAGPDAIYIRAVQYGGDTYSALLKWEGGANARLMGIFSDDAKLIPDEVELSVADLDLRGGDTLEISNVVVQGLGYTGALEYLGGDEFRVTGIQRVPAPSLPQQEVNRLQGERDQLQSELAALERDLQTARREAQAAQAQAAQAQRSQTAAAAPAPASTAPAQPAIVPSLETIDPGLLSFNSAKASLAGPQSIYISSIQYGGREYSALLNYQGGASAALVGVFDDRGKLIPDSVDTSFADLELKAPNALEISNVVVEGLGYAGTLEYVGGNQFAVANVRRTQLPAGDRDRIARLEAQRRDLDRRLTSVQAELRAAEARVAGGSIGPAPTRSILSGFGRGQAAFGNWQSGANSVRQTNAASRFAKFTIPLSQSASDTLFGIQARASGSGWNGFGLHFFASGSTKSTGYGFGKSYLVWVTRDPRFYRTDTTYLQLYESNDDIGMVQLASVGLRESISSALNVEARYNVGDGTITLSVNGTPRLSYAVDAPIRRGDTIALRALGAPVEFTDLYVRTR